MIVYQTTTYSYHILSFLRWSNGMKQKYQSIDDFLSQKPTLSVLFFRAENWRSCISVFIYVKIQVTHKINNSQSKYVIERIIWTNTQNYKIKLEFCGFYYLLLLLLTHYLTESICPTVPYILYSLPDLQRSDVGTCFSNSFRKGFYGSWSWFINFFFRNTSEKRVYWRHFRRSEWSHH